MVLLDIVPPKLSEADKTSKAKRDGFAAGALDKLKKSRPAAFMHPRNATLVSIGNFDDDLGLVADCRSDHRGYRQAARHQGRRCSRSSRSSPRRDAVDRVEHVAACGSPTWSPASCSETFRKNFMIAHFFNPPRYMKLLELVAGR